MKLFNFAAELTNQIDIPHVSANASTVEVITNVVFAVIGVVSVLVIILAGIQIIVSAGDPAKIAKGRQTILYAVVGLIVSVSAFAIVQFVVSKT